MYWSNIGSGEHAYTKIWGEILARTQNGGAVMSREPKPRCRGYHAHVDTAVWAIIILIDVASVPSRGTIAPMDSHFYAACTSRHQSSMIPKALKIATLQKKNAPIPPHT